MNADGRWAERAAERAAETGQIRSLAQPLATADDLEPLVRLAAPARFVCLGEASHGTREYYHWRALLSRRLIEEYGFTWIGVEGDWPDCWRINRWVRGEAGQDMDARRLLSGFERWPTWMWANQEVAGFLTWLEANAEDALPAALQAWHCFIPYREDPQRYALSSRLVPRSCEGDVVALLAEVRRRTLGRMQDDPAAFDAIQNAIVATNAERYYRTMVRGDQQSWNIRDHHMSDTIDRVARHHGPASKGLVWAHNTHVGDARATDMAHDGMVNIGQLVRQRHPGEVVLAGFASYAGSVTAAESWGSPEWVMDVPAAVHGSHEDLLNEALAEPSVLVFGADRTGPWLTSWRGHRAIGVVYNPHRERGNYVPTQMGERYDALFWHPGSEALRPLHHEYQPGEPELETEPTGF
ncbi:erythromycin esterase-like protein [Arthrobacter sp. SLBN-83]|uniref:erythromycin esterase family protein n=1 Tax=Arthrobacter sp. SLBN-83 TaxID=2768449 RepID=UPI001153044F|nr:erythromycin esterase family protein [Arthrobacter sp. SLBN-83]TQJ59834.1 erythromycin esterase-like protein [Arthrobacter sp. SLBN-83]